MIPCIPEHVGEAHCPECGENHKEYGTLSERVLSPIDLDDILEIDSIDALMPIFKLRGEDEDGYYMQVVPALVVVSGDTVRVVWLNPNTDHGWVTVRTETDVDQPELLAEELGLTLRESTMQETKIEGMEVVREDYAT